MPRFGPLLPTADPFQLPNDGLIAEEPIQTWTQGDAQRPMDVCSQPQSFIPRWPTE